MQREPTVSYVQASDTWLKRTLVDLIETVSGRDKLADIYRHLRQTPFDHRIFFGNAIELGGLRLRYNPHDECQIPRDGPLVFVANHPFGIVDGLILCDLAARTRSDFRILLNNRLMKDEDLNTLFLPVDFDGTREATRRNVETKRAAQTLLAQGGTLVIFPAGGVATRGRFGFGPLEDLPWTTFTAKLVQQSKATVVPVRFEGENSYLFHLASSISESLRLALFIREVTRQIGTTIDFKIGRPLGFEDYAHLQGRQAMTRFLKSRVDELAQVHPRPRLEKLQLLFNNSH